jgi:hypothetical protein
VLLRAVNSVNKMLMHRTLIEDSEAIQLISSSIDQFHHFPPERLEFKELFSTNFRRGL